MSRSVPGLAIVLITRYIPHDRRGKSMAVIMSASSLGLGLGPVIGGSITQFLGWHDLFIVTGLTLFLIPVFFKLLPRETPQKGSFDLLGAVLLAIGTTGVLLFLTSRQWYTLVIGLCGTASVLAPNSARGRSICSTCFVQRQKIYDAQLAGNCIVH